MNISSVKVLFTEQHKYEDLSDEYRLNFVDLNSCAYTATETCHSCDSQNYYFISENRIVFSDITS